MEASTTNRGSRLRRAGPLLVSWQGARDRLRRLAAACDPDTRGSWFRPGLPIALLLFGAWLLPLMGAGAIRYLTGSSTEVGLAVALVAGALLVVMLRARPKMVASDLGKDQKNLQRMGWVLGVVFAGWALSVFYSRDMGAMPAYYGMDAGSHVWFRDLFINSDRTSYFGFNSLYSVTHLLDRLLPGPPTRSWSLAFYATVAVVAVTPLIAMVAVLQSPQVDQKARVAGLAIFAAAWCFILHRLALPLLANMQVDGFFAHLFGFLPFALVWITDLSCRPRLVRLVAVGLAIVVCRFTYGLNLGDLLVTCGCLWLIDAWGARRRPILLLAGVAAVGGAIVAYLNLAPMFKVGGYVEGYDFNSFVNAIGAGALLLGAYTVIEAWAARGVSARGEPRLPAGLASVVRFPILLALVSAIAAGRFWQMPGRESYYPLKYPMMPAVWLGGAACVVIGQITARALSRVGRRLQALAGIITIIGVIRLADGVDLLFAPLQAELAERNGQRPHPKLRPLVDEQVWNDIQTTLRSQRKAFGGFVSHDYTVSHFLNLVTGFQKLLPLYVSPATSPGHCVFWTHAPDDVAFAWHPAPAAVEADRAALEADPAKSCQSHQVPWSLTPRELCHRCY